MFPNQPFFPHRKGGSGGDMFWKSSINHGFKSAKVEKWEQLKDLYLVSLG